MKPLDLIEHGAWQSIPLDGIVGRALTASRVVSAAPDPRHSGHWRVKATGKVGAFTVNTADDRTITIRIMPKVSITRLLFLLGYALDPKGWRSEDVTLDAEPGLLPTFARFFHRQAERAVQQGLLQGYRAKEETAHLIQGRIREADQIRRGYGRMPPVEIVHDEYTADIAENQLLRSACDLLCHLPGVPRDVRGGLLRLHLLLADVTPIRPGRELPTWRPSRLNARYHTALRLADLALRGASVEHRPGDVTVSGFLFDMAKVFEDFVTIALRESLAGETGTCVLQATHHLDDQHAIRIVPDFVRYTDDGTPLAVVDAKYKVERPNGYPDADLYQILAYCTVLGLSEGHLIYAKGNAPHAAHHVQRAAITIHQHALDLDQPPAGLLADVRALAHRLH